MRKLSHNDTNNCCQEVILLTLLINVNAGQLKLKINHIMVNEQRNKKEPPGVVIPAALCDQGVHFFG